MTKSRIIKFFLALFLLSFLVELYLWTFNFNQYIIPLMNWLKSGSITFWIVTLIAIKIAFWIGIVIGYDSGSKKKRLKEKRHQLLTESQPIEEQIKTAKIYGSSLEEEYNSIMNSYTEGSLLNQHERSVIREYQRIYGIDSTRINPLWAQSSNPPMFDTLEENPGPQFGSDSYNCSFRDDGFWGDLNGRWWDKYGAPILLPLIALAIFTSGVMLYVDQKEQEAQTLLPLNSEYIITEIKAEENTKIAEKETKEYKENAEDYYIDFCWDWMNTMYPAYNQGVDIECSYVEVGHKCKCPVYKRPNHILQDTRVILLDSIKYQD